MIPNAVSFFLLVFAVAAALGCGVLWRRFVRCMAEAEAQRALGESRARSMALLARDMNSIGLGLLGRAQAVGGAVGPGFEAEARQILALADAAAEEGASAATARFLAEEQHPLAPILREAVAVASAQLGPGIRHWRIAPEIEALTVTADRRALRGAMVQVLGRAARATTEGDFIDIRADLRPHAACIVVEDEGVGLAIEDLAPAAYDGNPERTRGLGFGLSLARSLLRAHGGELVIEAAPGIGARAFLSLPPERIVPAVQSPAMA